MAEIKLWKDREKKILDPALFSKTAKEWADKIDRFGRRNQNDETGRRNNKDKNSSTQIRRFFDEIARLNIKAQSGVEPWEVVLPQVHMMIAKAAYAEGRDLVTSSFVNMLGDTIRDEISDKDDLKVFCNFFEAFMGYYKALRRN